MDQEFAKTVGIARHHKERERERRGGGEREKASRVREIY